MKKNFPMLLAFLLCTCLLSACACQHQWTEATCTESRICTKCSLTEGQALGHSWVDADCITAKTCSRCAATEGNPLGHNWLEATCTTPKVCTLCAATEGAPLEHTWDAEPTLYTAPSCSVCGAEGDPLPGYLAQKGLSPNVFPGLAADYVTSTLVRPDLNTTGMLTVSDIEIFSYDRTHYARAGYEWRRAEIAIYFTENRAKLHSASVAYARANYYEEQLLQEPKRQEHFPITYNDQEYWCVATYEEKGFSYDDHGIVFRMTFCVQVPVGYDGVVLAFHHPGLDINGLQLPDVEDENLLILQMK